MVVVGLSVWTSLGLHCKVRHCIHVLCILTNILVVLSFVLWAALPYVDLENRERCYHNLVKIHKTRINLQLYNIILKGIGPITLN